MAGPPSSGLGPNARRLVAIMIADVVGYSRLMSHDEEGTHVRMTRIRRDIVEPSIAEHDGVLVKHMGDGFLATFASPLEATRCAIVIQHTVEARNAATGDKKNRISYRIGINLGDVIFDNNDVFGDGVNVAARLQTAAEPGSINISGGVYEQVKNKLVCGYQSLGDEKLKNITDPVRMYRVLPDPSAVGRADHRARRLFRMGALVMAACLAAFAVGVRYASRGVPDREPALLAGAETPAAGQPAGRPGAAQPPRPVETAAEAVASPAAAMSPREAQMAALSPTPPPAALRPSMGTPGDCHNCPEMVLLPGGSFRMGDAQDWNARPVHDVSIAPLAIGRFPVTNREWRACLDARACSLVPAGQDGSAVRNVSWDDAQQYLGWLSRTAGKVYRLPTEAEWEYAARGGTTTAYWWGDGLVPGLADCKGCGGLHDQTRPALLADLRPNPFGLVAMGGGVAEWVADCWHATYQTAPRTGPWLTPGCRERVLRGGSWQAGPEDIKVTSRTQYDAGVRYPTHGFRVALTRE